MKPSPTPELAHSRITVRAINFELDDTLHALASDRAAALLRLNPRIQLVCLELENDPSRDTAHEYVAKGKIDFGGPALLASVTGSDAATTLDYLIEQLEHQLRKQRRTRSAASGPSAQPPAS